MANWDIMDPKSGLGIARLEFDGKSNRFYIPDLNSPASKKVYDILRQTFQTLETNQEEISLFLRQAVRGGDLTTGTRKDGAILVSSFEPSLHFIPVEGGFRLDIPEDADLDSYKPLFKQLEKKHRCLSRALSRFLSAANAHGPRERNYPPRDRRRTGDTGGSSRNRGSRENLPETIALDVKAGDIEFEGKHHQVVFSAPEETQKRLTGLKR